MSKPKPIDEASKKNAEALADQLRRAGELMRLKKIEEKEKKKEKTAKLQAYLKEWQRVKDDLELEDHKVKYQRTIYLWYGGSPKGSLTALALISVVHRILK